jgi:hypothetical protein
VTLLSHKSTSIGELASTVMSVTTSIGVVESTFTKKVTPWVRVVRRAVGRDVFDSDRGGADGPVLGAGWVLNDELRCCDEDD